MLGLGVGQEHSECPPIRSLAAKESIVRKSPALLWTLESRLRRPPVPLPPFQSLSETFAIRQTSIWQNMRILQSTLNLLKTPVRLLDWGRASSIKV